MYSLRENFLDKNEDRTRDKRTTTKRGRSGRIKRQGKRRVVEGTLEAPSPFVINSFLIVRLLSSRASERLGSFEIHHVSRLIIII